MAAPRQRGYNPRVIARLDQIAGELAAQLRQARATVQAERTALHVAERQAQDATEAQRIIQAIARTMQQAAHAQIAGLVSRCLSAVFEAPYEFKIHFEAKRGKTEARFTFQRGDYELDPLTASGGGVVDVAAFALRLAALLLSRPPVRRILVLDEPFRYVSAQYQPALAALLAQLASELDLKIVLVTHAEALRLGTIIPL